jgi:hypothetical protein
MPLPAPRATASVLASGRIAYIAHAGALWRHRRNDITSVGAEITRGVPAKVHRSPTPSTMALLLSIINADHPGAQIPVIGKALLPSRPNAHGGAICSKAREILRGVPLIGSAKAIVVVAMATRMNKANLPIMRTPLLGATNSTSRGRCYNCNRAADDKDWRSVIGQSATTGGRVAPFASTQGRPLFRYG